jgi:hypothetical protein
MTYGRHRRYNTQMVSWLPKHKNGVRSVVSQGLTKLRNGTGSARSTTGISCDVAAPKINPEAGITGAYVQIARDLSAYHDALDKPEACRDDVKYRLASSNLLHIFSDSGRTQGKDPCGGLAQKVV